MPSVLLLYDVVNEKVFELSLKLSSKFLKGKKGNTRFPEAGRDLCYTEQCTITCLLWEMVAILFYGI